MVRFSFEPKNIKFSHSLSDFFHYSPVDIHSFLSPCPSCFLFYCETKNEKEIHIIFRLPYQGGFFMEE
jgi:hypothetical protein